MIAGCAQFIRRLAADWQERAQARQFQEQVQTLQEEQLRLQTLNAQYLQRVTQAENRQQAVQTTAEDFARSVSAELVQRRTRDALAEYLQVNPGDLLINMEDLEGLALALQKEVSDQWNDNIVHWRHAIVTEDLGSLIGWRRSS